MLQAIRKRSQKKGDVLYLSNYIILVIDEIHCTQVHIHANAILNWVDKISSIHDCTNATHN